MNLVVDESVEREIVDRLRADGHDVHSIAELASGIADDDVLDLANAEAAILLTGDKDFGELVYRLRRASHGVILLRLAGISNASKAEAVSRVLTDHEGELAGAFTVVAPGSVRIRQRNTGR